MDRAIHKNGFAICDTSGRVVNLIKTTARIHQDQFLSQDVRSKIYSRLCTAGPEHTPYADDIDLNKLRVSDNSPGPAMPMNLRSSKRLGQRAAKAQEKAQETPGPAMPMNLRSTKRQRAAKAQEKAQETPGPAMPMNPRSTKRQRAAKAQEKAQETPTLSGILRSLDAYCTWAFGEKGQMIFQNLFDGGKNSGGDNLRAEIKMDQLPPVTGKLSGENEEQYYDRHAGRIASLAILEDAFFGILQGIRPGTGIPRTFEFPMASLLNANATQSSVQRQDGHLDKKPEVDVQGFAALTSISAAKDERANVGVVPKSASMIKKLLKLRRQFPEFCEIFNATLSNKTPGRLLHESIMHGKSLKEKQEAGWDFLCKQLMDQKPEEFTKLCPFEIELLPFEWLVFDSDLLHWGGPYRQSGHHNFRQFVFFCVCVCVCVYL
jgi:hypothetical protein